MDPMEKGAYQLAGLVVGVVACIGLAVWWLVG